VLAHRNELLREAPRKLVVLREHVQHEALRRLFPDPGETGEERDET
jgi:hypothetical protein